MTKFIFKTYRCEWTVELGSVDQYGLDFRPYASHAFPTREEALAFLPTVASESPYVKQRWIPKNAPHGYCEARINYREILVEPTTKVSRDHMLIEITKFP